MKNKDIAGISDIIRNHLLSEYLGKGNAKNRIFLLTYCHYFEPGLKDREMRRIYNSILPMAWCRKGIYVVDDPEEIEKAIQTRESTKEAHEKAIVKLKEYKTFLIRRKREEERRKEAMRLGQLNLFEGRV